MIKRSIPVVGLLAGFTALAMAQKEESIASFGARSSANLEGEAMELTGEACPSASLVKTQPRSHAISWPQALGKLRYHRVATVLHFPGRSLTSLSSGQ